MIAVFIDPWTQFMMNYMHGPHNVIDVIFEFLNIYHSDLPFS